MRNKGLDLLRIISAIAVVLIHCNAVFYFSDIQHDRMTLGIEAFINLITRFSVPCFMMISGAFSLANEKNKAVLSFYKKSFSKILVPYAGIFLFWIILDSFKVMIGKETVLGVVRNALHGTKGNLWFMPMLLLCYVITPFLIYAIKNLNERTLKIIFVFWLVWAIVSQTVTEYEVPYAIGVVFAYAAYYFAGYYIAKQPPIGSNRIVCGGV